MRGWSRKNKEYKTTANQIDIEKEPSVTKARTAINIEDTTKFCNEFRKTLGYKYFSGTLDQNDDSETFDIDFVIQNFKEQTIVPTDKYQNVLFAIFWRHYGRIQSSVKHQRWSPFVDIVEHQTVKYFCKRLHFRHLPEFWIKLWICPRYFLKEWTNQFSISWVFFGKCINFLGQNFVQIKAKNNDINHLSKNMKMKICFASQNNYLNHVYNWIVFGVTSTLG